MLIGELEGGLPVASYIVDAICEFLVGLAKEGKKRPVSDMGCFQSCVSTPRHCMYNHHHCSTKDISLAQM